MLRLTDRLLGTATDYSAVGVRLLIRADPLLGHGDRLLGHKGQDDAWGS